MDETITNIGKLLKELEGKQVDNDEYRVMYAALYVAARVVVSCDPILMQAFMDWLKQFTTDVMDRDNDAVH